MAFRVLSQAKKLRGYLSAPTSYRWRGAWAGSTKYVRGDIITDPSGTLRWCGVSHTSTSTFNTGTEYLTNGPWWLPIATNGVFRGSFAASVAAANASGGSIQYTPGDLVLDDTTGQIVRALYSNSGASLTWNSTLFDDMGPIPPFAPVTADVILPAPGMPATDVTGHGLWPLRSKLRYPKVKPLAMFTQAADFTSVSGTATQDIAGATSTPQDPLAPQGSVILTYAPGGGNVAIKQLAANVDLSNAIIRLPVRIPGSGVTGLRSSINHSWIDVSSDGFTSGNYAECDFCPGSSSQLGDTVWDWAGVGPSDWIQVGTGANMAAIDAVRFRLIGTSAATCEVHRVDVLPNNGAAGSKGDGRAKCVLWFDDSYSNDWLSGVALMAQYGFPGTAAAAGAIDGNPGSNPSSLTSQQVRYMAEFHGWQFATHYYFPNDGSDPQAQSGMAMEAWIMRSRHFMNGAGAWGQDDYAWHDSTHLTAANYPVIKKYFRTVRKYSQGDGRVDTLPPINPWAMRGYGIGTSDVTGGTIATIAPGGVAQGAVITSLPIATTGQGGSGLTQGYAPGESVTVAGQTFITSSAASGPGGSVASIPIQQATVTAIGGLPATTAVLNPGSGVKAQIDKAIQYAGLAQVIWENFNTASHPDFTNIVLYLNAKRSQIDVVTVADAIQPWTVAP